MNTLVIFIGLNVANVIIQTIKSLLTVKSSKTVAAVANAVAYGLYTIVLIYMNCDLDLYLKAIIVAICNLIGVYIVKDLEEKSKKAKLWKVEVTVLNIKKEKLIEQLKLTGISFNYVESIGQYTIFNIYCVNQKQSKIIKEMLAISEAKFFVSESKNL